MRCPRAVCLAAAAMAAAGCVSHPVGPARTYGKYEGKAVTTAESALSEVETVKLAAEAKTFGRYTAVVVSDAEESLAGLAGTFGSIQPPDERADELRDELDQLLSDAADHVTEVRITIRRGDTADTSALDGDSEALSRFIQEHEG